MTSKKKPPAGSRLVGMIVVLTKDSDAHHRHMASFADGHEPHGCKLIDTEGEVVDTWRDDGQWVQLRVLAGDRGGELITMGADQVKVVRTSLDPEGEKRDASRRELLGAAAAIYAALVLIGKDREVDSYDELMVTAVRDAAKLDSFVRKVLA